ncbi:MAG: hypothetical protein ACOYJA_04245 [Christensenellales bacterium]|jgi:hypothetical protein
MRHVIHLTDLYHPHNDPDDHWDLAVQYALAQRGDIHLAGIVCDAKREPFGDPAVGSIAQLNHITGRFVPVAVGSPEAIRSAADLQRAASGPLPASVKMILETLRTHEQVALHVCGSCRDVATAAQVDPDLFRRRCCGVYLNAGSSKPGTELEWNVRLEPYCYARIFQIPCRVYWLPCFYESPIFTEHRLGSFFSMPQREVLPALPEAIQKYFLYMFTKERATGWLEYLERPLDREALDRFAQDDRALYCTPGFFHGAGRGVTAEGEETAVDDAQSVFTFQPVGVQVSDDGVLQRLQWGARSNVAMLVKRDEARFSQGMRAAIRRLLSRL